MVFWFLEIILESFYRAEVSYRLYIYLYFLQITPGARSQEPGARSQEPGGVIRYSIIATQTTSVQAFGDQYSDLLKPLYCVLEFEAREGDNVNV